MPCLRRGVHLCGGRHATDAVFVRARVGLARDRLRRVVRRDGRDVRHVQRGQHLWRRVGSAGALRLQWGLLLGVHLHRRVRGQERELRRVRYWVHLSWWWRAADRVHVLARVCEHDGGCGRCLHDERAAMQRGGLRRWFHVHRRVLAAGCVPGGLQLLGWQRVQLQSRLRVVVNQLEPLRGY